MTGRVKRILYLWFPGLSARAFEYLAKNIKTNGAVVFGSSGRQVVIKKVLATGDVASFKVGMHLSRAVKEVSKTAFVANSPEVSRQLLRFLARPAFKISPHVTNDEDDGLIIDITACAHPCAHLCGGEHKLLDRMVETYRVLGFSVRACISDTIGASKVAARNIGRNLIIKPRNQQNVLALLPLDCFGFNLAELELCNKLGLFNFADLLAVPRQERVGRFSDHLLQTIINVLGREGCYCEFLPVNEKISAAIDFSYEAHAIADIKEAVELLLRRVCDQLEYKGAGGRFFELVIKAEDACKAITFKTGTPCADRKFLWSLFKPGVEGVGFSGVINEMQLRVKDIQKVEYNVSDMPGNTCEQVEKAQLLPAYFNDLVNLVNNLLGAGNMRICYAVNRQLPEEQFVVNYPCKPGFKPCKFSIPEADCNYRFARVKPRRLLQQPEEVYLKEGGYKYFDETSETDVQLVCNKPPEQFLWRGKKFKVRILGGPERISPAWWSSGNDFGEREYWWVMNNQGLGLWLFFGSAAKKWFVHGIGC